MEKFVLATFDEKEGMQVNLDGVNPIQILGLAGYLEWYAKLELMKAQHEIEEKEAHNKLAIPKPDILLATK